MRLIICLFLFVFVFACFFVNVCCSLLVGLPIYLVCVMFEMVVSQSVRLFVCLFDDWFVCLFVCLLLLLCSACCCCCCSCDAGERLFLTLAREFLLVCLFKYCVFVCVCWFIVCLHVLMQFSLFCLALFECFCLLVSQCVCLCCCLSVRLFVCLFVVNVSLFDHTPGLFQNLFV